MKLLRKLNSLAVLERGAAVTIGNFDGVHKGHQALLNRLSECARWRDLLSVVVCFEPQPAEFFNKNSPVRLMSFQQKLRMFQTLPVDYVHCIRFNQKLANISSHHFAENYLFKSLHAKYLIVGEDFRFGQGREGTTEELSKIGKQFDCEVETFCNFIENKERVSSTAIRDALAEGDLQRAAFYLGRPYSLSGRVVNGDARARMWGFPTANVWLKHQRLALSGVFLVRVRALGAIYWGVANVGYRPTFAGVHPRLEVHLFNFDSSLYKQPIEVFFIEQLRQEQKFASTEALVEQIERDCEQAKLLIANKRDDYDRL